MTGRPDVSDLAHAIARHCIAMDLRDPKDVQRYLRQGNLEQEVQRYVAWVFGIESDEEFLGNLAKGG